MPSPRDVVEVLPYAAAGSLAGNACLCGRDASYRGLPMPVVDLMRLSYATSCPLLWNTRIIVVRRPSCLPAADGSTEGCVGLLVNGVSTCPIAGRGTRDNRPSRPMGPARA